MPIVYIQYTTAPAADADQFAQKLRDLGYQVPGIEATPLAKGLNEVRFFMEATGTRRASWRRPLRASSRNLATQL